MPPLLHVEFIPQLEAARPQALRGAAVGVIDLLRATTTITAALQAGCGRVIPCSTVDEARETGRKLQQQGESVVLAGERGGRKVAGFDLGNSPAEFRGNLRNKIVVLTTSNGTRALRRAQVSSRALAVCLNNAQAAARRLAQFPGNRVVLLASGESGEPAEEDTLAAGIVIGQLLKTGRKVRLSCLAETVWRMARVVDHAKLTEKFLLNTPHGQDLIRLGFRSDILSACRQNTSHFVGLLTKNGIIP